MPPISAITNAAFSAAVTQRLELENILDENATVRRHTIACSAITAACAAVTTATMVAVGHAHIAITTAVVLLALFGPFLGRALGQCAHQRNVERAIELEHVIVTLAGNHNVDVGHLANTTLGERGTRISPELFAHAIFTVAPNARIDYLGRELVRDLHPLPSTTTTLCKAVVQDNALERWAMTGAELAELVATLDDPTTATAHELIRKEHWVWPAQHSKLRRPTIGEQDDELAVLRRTCDLTGRFTADNASKAIFATLISDAAGPMTYAELDTFADVAVQLASA